MVQQLLYPFPDVLYLGDNTSSVWIFIAIPILSASVDDATLLAFQDETDKHNHHKPYTCCNLPYTWHSLPFQHNTSAKHIDTASVVCTSLTQTRRKTQVPPMSSLLMNTPSARPWPTRQRHCISEVKSVRISIQEAEVCCQSQPVRG